MMFCHVAAYFDATPETALVVRGASEIAERLGARFTLLHVTPAVPEEQREAQLREIEGTLSRLSATAALTYDHLITSRLAAWVESHAVDLFVAGRPERSLLLTLIRPWLPPEPTARLRKTAVLFLPTRSARPVDERDCIAGLSTYR